MPGIDPYPWVKRGFEGTTAIGLRWGYEFPLHDGEPLTHLDLVFDPRPGYVSDRSLYDG